jgi:dTMP kinase
MRVDPSTFRVSPQPMFIAFEGINGCGKTTLMRSISATLRAHHNDVVETREPGGTPLGDELRKLLLEWPGEKISERTELLLFAAGRAEHVDKVIRPALARGRWVLCDRYLYSSVAFQGYGRGIDRTLIDQANTFAVQGLLPNLVVLLDLGPVEAGRRIAARSGGGKDSFEGEEMAFHERIRRGFLECADSSPVPFLVLDGMRTPDQLHQSLCTVLGLG